MMQWAGDVVFGDAWAAYRGSAAENSLHAHAALQLALGRDADVFVTLEDDQIVRGRALLIRPGVPHAIAAKGDVGLIYFEPQAPLAFALLDQVGIEDVEQLPHEIWKSVDMARPPERWVVAIEDALPAPSQTLDARLSIVLRELAANSGRDAISLVASRNGLSASHLRELARDQLGFPLSTWLIWRKLERSMRELAVGVTLIEAALAGGFADQAHFTRAMRRMFGVTPGEVKRTLT